MSLESENEDEISDRVEDDFEKNDSEINDDEVLLYKGVKVSKFGVLIIVMFFSLRYSFFFDGSDLGADLDWTYRFAGRFFAGAARFV